MGDNIILSILPFAMIQQRGRERKDKLVMDCERGGKYKNLKSSEGNFSSNLNFHLC